MFDRKGNLAKQALSDKYYEIIPGEAFLKWYFSTFSGVE